MPREVISGIRDIMAPHSGAAVIFLILGGRRTPVGESVGERWVP
jgi:hypothetical protein